jgi:hypothetical protein
MFDCPTFISFHMYDDSFLRVNFLQPPHNFLLRSVVNTTYQSVKMLCVLAIFGLILQSLASYFVGILGCLAIAGVFQGYGYHLAVIICIISLNLSILP